MKRLKSVDLHNVFLYQCALLIGKGLLWNGAAMFVMAIVMPGTQKGVFKLHALNGAPKRQIQTNGGFAWSSPLTVSGDMYMSVIPAWKS